MDVVVPMINFIRFKALNHRLFGALLEKVSSEYTDLITFNSVRLHQGKNH